MNSISEELFQSKIYMLTDPQKLPPSQLLSISTLGRSPLTNLLEVYEQTISKALAFMQTMLPKFQTVCSTQDKLEDTLCLLENRIIKLQTASNELQWIIAGQKLLEQPQTVTSKKKSKDNETNTDNKNLHFQPAVIFDNQQYSECNDVERHHSLTSSKNCKKVRVDTNAEIYVNESEHQQSKMEVCSKSAANFSDKHNDCGSIDLIVDSIKKNHEPLQKHSKEKSQKHQHLIQNSSIQHIPTSKSIRKGNLKSTIRVPAEGQLSLISQKVLKNDSVAIHIDLDLEKRLQHVEELCLQSRNIKNNYEEVMEVYSQQNQEQLQNILNKVQAMQYRIDKLADNRQIDDIKQLLQHQKTQRTKSLDQIQNQLVSINTELLNVELVRAQLSRFAQAKTQPPKQIQQKHIKQQPQDKKQILQTLEQILAQLNQFLLWKNQKQDEDRETHRKRNRAIVDLNAMELSQTLPNYEKRNTQSLLRSSSRSRTKNNRKSSPISTGLFRPSQQTNQPVKKLARTNPSQIEITYQRNIKQLRKKAYLLGVKQQSFNTNCLPLTTTTTSTTTYRREINSFHIPISRQK